MDLITLDFETYYDKDFSLRKVTTEAYIRDHQFEVIGVGVKVNDGQTEWASGTHEQIKRYLHNFDWADSMLLCHNTMFDGAILSAPAEEATVQAAIDAYEDTSEGMELSGSRPLTAISRSLCESFFASRDGLRSKVLLSQ